LQRDKKLKINRLYAPSGTFRENVTLTVSGPHTSYHLRMGVLEETLRHNEIIQVIPES